MSAYAFRRPLALTIGLSTLTLSATLLVAPSQHPSRLPLRPTLCDTSPSPLRSSDWTSRRDTLPPPSRFLSARSIRQISTGSILGLLGGVAVGMFSRTLGVLLGVGVVLVQYLETKGVHVVPYARIQKYVKGVDLRSAVAENVVWKVAFGTTFALAAFAEF